MFSLLAAHNITCVTICFDGYGDSGQVESVNALIGDTVAELPNCMVMLSEIARCGDSGAIVTKEHSLAAAIEDLAYDLLRQTHAGWENNDGAFGDFVLDVTERTISLDYSERYTAIESFSHQW
ncbi:hypothetical protein FJQ54_00555 [Sandaracinobacter neustonicus]|uniref:DUF6878 domain-containing protein n=1 Tax=Sandaracinobacter neustonicus TaxID=1715348 RepID=A0A501XWL2_9SPHN|nr:hypothetical protein FJQ54_00555 [Sandaracinobacter neustonicus]